MLYGQQTTIEAILAAVQQKLVDDDVAATDYIFETLAGDEEYDLRPNADTFVTMTPTSGRPLYGDVAGGGSAMTTIDLQLSIGLWRRLWIDQDTKDTQLLGNPALGILPKWRLFVKSLQMFAAPGTPNSLFVEPMRLLGFDIKPRTVNEQRWAKVTSLWQVLFVMDLQ